jgi:hypothetical protein
MPVVLFLILGVYGLSMILFAFVKPPVFLEHFFRVPAIFIFLPDKWVLPVGRVFVGICCFGVLFFINNAIKG